MSLLAPLGLLGLLGIIALIIIYIIKPNYQNKFISSTFIWKLSLKYKKKKIPINKLRNIILFICQVLILAGAAFILAQPFIDTEDTQAASDVILVIDASASMQTVDASQQTRLERAANEALADAKKAFDSGKRVSVILASEKPTFLAREVTKDQADTVYNALDMLISTPEELYTFGTPDIEGAMKLAEELTSQSENTAVTLYSDTTFLGTEKVAVKKIVDVSEWNAAILDVRATMIDGNYRIEIDVASYGKDSNLIVTCEVFNVNGEDRVLEIESNAYCSNDEVTTLVFGQVTDGMSQAEIDLITEVVSVNRYDQLYVHVDEYDSLSYDNQFYLYGGNKPTLKIKYVSTLPNNFWFTGLELLADSLRNEWNIQIDKNPEVMTEGFDLYIFEHGAPKTIPTDGVVIYSDPTSLPGDAGIRFGSPIDIGSELFLSKQEDHEVLKSLRPENISITAFTPVLSYDGYTPIIGYNDQYPLVLLKNDIDQKIVVMPFSLHYSNLAIVPEFPLLLRNLINYYFPLTIEDNVFEPGDKLSLNARSNALSVTGPKTDLTFETFPAEMTVSLPGTYTLTQYLMSGSPSIEYVFVKIPSIESNINHVEETLVNPYFFEETEENYIDLLFYFALAVVALLFLEWWLKSREQI